MHNHRIRNFRAEDPGVQVKPNAALAELLGELLHLIGTWCIAGSVLAAVVAALTWWAGVHLLEVTIVRQGRRLVVAAPVLLMMGILLIAA